MSLPFLDIPTLFVVSALVIAFLGSLLVIARGRDGGAAPLLFWGAAMLVGAAGVVLLALAPSTRDPVYAAGNVAILVGVALSWTGARAFGGRRVRPVLLCAGAAAWLGVHLLPWLETPNAARQSAFLIGAIYVLATAVELWRGRVEELPTRRWAVLLLLVHAAVYLLQLCGSWVHPAAFHSALATQLLMLEALLHTTGMAFLFLALMRDRAERRATVHLQHLALHDGLTGLGNRRLFDQALKTQFQLAIASRSSLALLMIDVDQFKSYNDTYGHQAGDDCLRSVAQAVGAVAGRNGSMAMRYGGEEFAVLLPGAGAAVAAPMAERLCRSVEALRIVHASSARAVVTISVGVACCSPQKGGSMAGDLLQIADQALYRAKAAGRNTSRTWSDDD